MSSLRLPKDPERTELAVFWSVTVIGLTALAVVLGSVTDLVTAWAVGAVVLLGAVVFFVSPGFVRGAYRGWDVLATAYARLARDSVLRVMHWCVIWVVRATGSNLPTERPGRTESGWRPRGTLSPSRYPGEGAVEGSAEARPGGWVRRMSRWAFRSGREWSVALVPFLLLLRGLGVDEADEPAPRDIYTLY